MNNTTMVGAKGEAKVISELTDRGWAVAKPLLDLGVDLLACKIENHTVRTVAIQVRTLDTPSHDRGTCYGFQLNREKVIDGVFYIIVCPTIEEFVIIPSAQVRQKPHWHQRQAEWQRFKNRWELVR
jgi:hypothetical protein